MKSFIQLILLANLLLASMTHAQIVPSSCNNLLLLKPCAVALVVTPGDAADGRIPSPSNPGDAFPADNPHCKPAVVQAPPPVVSSILRPISSPRPTATSHGPGQTSGRIDRPPDRSLGRSRRVLPWRLQSWRRQSRAPSPRQQKQSIRSTVSRCAPLNERRMQDRGPM